MSGDTLTKEEHTQLLVTKSRREFILQAACYNPMVEHTEYDKTLEQIMDRFYWLSI